MLRSSARCPLRHNDFECEISNNFITDLFSRNKFIYRGTIEIYTGVFHGKMCLDRRKNHGCGQKNQKTLALLYLASGPLSLCLFLLFHGQIKGIKIAKVSFLV